jgi:anthranilate phosphoribosyltransferase
MSTPLAEALEQLGAGRDLDESATHAAVTEIMGGEVSEAAIAAFLTALRVKGETASELAGAVRAVRERMAVWERGPGPVLDTCGTGGDGAGTFNISTATALIVAASGVAVAKHGNRSASGHSGSAEVLAELGIAIEAETPRLRRCLDELKITFLFAPRFHPALRCAAPVRRQLPFRTLFNLVGPLANPARPEYQLLGVPSERLADVVAQALLGLGLERAAVVTGSDGLDEVTLSGPTQVRWVEAGRINSAVWTPADFGLSPVVGSDLRVSGPVESAQRLRALLCGEPGPCRDIVLANAAAALWIAGRVGSLREGVAAAARVIDSGAAAELVERWAALSQSSG